MISDTHRCLFVHIPKTAGTSIEEALGGLAGLRLGPGKVVPRGTQDHRTIMELRRAMPPGAFAQYFRFSFVRNPWARVASWYKNVVNDPNHRAQFGVREACPFPEFLEQQAEIFGMQPQLHWLREKDGSIPLDFIGRFERLEEDFARVCNRLGIPDSSLPHLTRQRDRRPYSAIYDETTRRIVADRYGEEIAMFGYRFAEDLPGGAPT